jgi:hypothetical protein
MNVFSVRPALLTDLSWMLVECEKFCDIYDTKAKLFPTPEFAEKIVGSFIEHHVVLVAEHIEKGPVGFIGGVLTPHLFNPEIKVLAETFWWVKEEWRGTRAGHNLLAAFVDVGKKHSDWITLSVIQKTPIKEEALLKRGFVCLERNYLMEVL